jgi:hypothetical protein
MNAKDIRNLAKKAKFYMAKPNARIRYEVEAFMATGLGSGEAGGLGHRLTAVIMHAPSDKDLHRLASAMLHRGPNHFGATSAHDAYGDYESLKAEVDKILEATKCVS